MSTVEQEFSELLDALPIPGQCSLESVLSSIQSNITRPPIEFEEGSMVFLSSGFMVTVLTHGCSSVVIHSVGLDFSDYPALAVTARDYASKHQASLEAYYFSDVNQGMFAFGIAQDTSQHEVIG